MQGIFWPRNSTVDVALCSVIHGTCVGDFFFFSIFAATVSCAAPFVVHRVENQDRARGEVWDSQLLHSGS